LKGVREIWTVLNKSIEETNTNTMISYLFDKKNFPRRYIEIIKNKVKTGGIMLTVREIRRFEINDVIETRI
jgi:hypothetical protein